MKHPRDLFLAQMGIAALVAVGLVLLVMAPAFAFTLSPNGATFDAKYTEPTTVSTGAPLTNLTSCTVSYSVSKNGGAATAAAPVIIPASSPNGGGAITKSITDTTLVPGNNYSINGAVACTNPAGTGASLPTAAPLVIQRAGEVPPGVVPGALIFQ